MNDPYSDAYRSPYVFAAVSAKCPYEDADSIRGFFGPYRFLSNFYASPIIVGRLEYPTVENAYHAMKTKNKDLRARMAQMSPGNAKKFGQEIPLRTDENWDTYKRVVMLRLLFLKFEIPELRGKLLTTENKYLEEANTWGDKCWGVHYTKSACTGLNVLGTLLKIVRDAL